MGKPTDKIDISAKRFKVISKSSLPKARFLSNWLLTKSYHLDREMKNKNTKFFDCYKNGTVVRIDFGVNIGNEMSNHHFGVILNKKDNRRNGIVTVLPLSSKESSHYLKLNDELFKIISADMAEKSQKISFELDEIKAILDEVQRAAKNNDEKVSFSDNGTQVEATLSNMYTYLDERLNKLIEENEKIRAVYSVYQKYDKDTFVCIKNIQTLSKLRIFKINDMDPSGKMRLSKSTMEKIDLAILENYTNVKTNNKNI